MISDQEPIQLPETLPYNEEAQFQREFDLPPTQDQLQEITINNDQENPRDKNFQKKNYTNLPLQKEFQDSAEPVKNLFDKYFVENISLPANEVDAVVGFFEKRGFEKTSAVNVASVILQQAKVDNVKIFTLMDTLKGMTYVELSRIVAEILNVNRSKITSLGYKVNDDRNQFNKRNIRI